MSATSSLLTFSTISSPLTQTGIVQVTSQSSLNQPTSSSTYIPYNPYPSPDPNQNSNPDPFNTGPTVYLYGFLATLGVIFAVSIGIAWRGYYARRLLRARIEEALARGVVLPGYSAEYPYLGGVMRPVTQLGPRPVIHDVWMDIKQDHEKYSLPPNAWDIKPVSLDLLRPASPIENPSVSFSPRANASTLFRQLVDPIREFWFVSPPEGTHPGQLQGRSTQSPNSRTPNPREANVEGGDGDGIDWEGAEGATLAILITMPSPNLTWDGRRKGKGHANSRLMSFAAPGRTSSSEIGEREGVEEEEEKELPELVFGYAVAALPVNREAVVDGSSDFGMGPRTKSEGGG